jgi:predicted nucleotidyltransferase component of viral defense system
MNFSKLSAEERQKHFTDAQAILEFRPVSIEKDWWVSAVLRALFALPYAENLSFKGGTSLSKCWHLIERFSEDIDIAVNREYLGFSEPLSKTQIKDKLRRAACSFVREKLQFDLAKQLENDGIDTALFSVSVNITSVTTTDPEIIEVRYKSLFQEDTYIKPKVIIEVGGRSMKEPLQTVKMMSMLDEAFPDAPFTEMPFSVQAVVPHRTFIEKICLLHEEFAKPKDLIRSERMSRHLYDLAKIMDTPIASEALTDQKLYSSVIEHRRIFIALKDFNYDTLIPKSINLIPPAVIINKWKTDYEIMQQTMIYGASLPLEIISNCFIISRAFVPLYPKNFK